jgi:hypothetical protein
LTSPAIKKFSAGTNLDKVFFFWYSDIKDDVCNHVALSQMKKRKERQNIEY